MSPTAVQKTDAEEAVLKFAKARPLSKKANTLEFVDKLPASTQKRFAKYGIDVSKGYPGIPERSEIPTFLDEALSIRNTEFKFDDRGKYADKEKKALFGAATEVINLTKHIGTELVGVQLADLNEKQLDELALLIAERVVVFFRNQDISPQKQLEIGEYWGRVERHPQAGHVPLPGRDSTEQWAKGSGVTTIWNRFAAEYRNTPQSFKTVANGWHTDLVHELQPAGLSHLHNDALPETGGDTSWSSGYAAYDKLSPAFQKFIDGKTAIYRSAHPYLDRENPLKGPVYIEREHPIVRTHPVTGWKTLFVNRAMTSRIVGLEPEESKLILEYLFSIFEKNLDIQVRFKWQSKGQTYGTSAIWDNRVSEHNPIPDYELTTDERHGTRVVTFGEVPYFDEKSKSQRESLGLA